MLSGSALDPECRAPVRMSVRSSLRMHMCMPLTWRVCAGSRVCERAFLLAFELAPVRDVVCVRPVRACARAGVCGGTVCDACSHSSPQANLGLMYEKGWGVPSDVAEAVRWYAQPATSSQDPL